MLIDKLITQVEEGIRSLDKSNTLDLIFLQNLLRDLKYYKEFKRKKTIK